MTTVKIVPMPGSPGPQGPQGPEGKKGINWTGPWSSTSSYIKDDAVEYMGSSYIAIQSSVYQPPSGSPNYWQLLAAGSENQSQTWTPPNSSSLYEIHQFHGGIEVQTNPMTQTNELVTIVQGDYINSPSFCIQVSPSLDSDFNDIFNGLKHFRNLSIDLVMASGILRYCKLDMNLGNGVWLLKVLDGTVTVYENSQYSINLEYNGDPVLWWNADDLTATIYADSSEWYRFRGAKIDYHAYSTDSGTMIGTIYIAHDSNDGNVTHIETGSGGNDLGTVNLWYRKNTNWEDERKLYMYRSDGESSTTRIHWTAQAYYSPEYWD